MTNKERYKQAFSVLHASDDMILEVTDMEKRKRAYTKKVWAAGAAAAILFGSMTAAYAADVGNIQERLTMWFHGEEVEVTGSAWGADSYQYTFTDSEGKQREFVAGGMVIDDSGRKRTLSAKEVLGELTDEVIYTDTEAVKLYYYDKKLEIDITDFFDSEGVCRVAVRDGGKLVYFTIRDNGGGDFDFEKTVDEPENAGRYIVVE